MEIRMAANGYIVLDDAMNYLLVVFEGPAPMFFGYKWGRVIIERAPVNDARENKA